MKRIKKQLSYMLLAAVLLSAAALQSCEPSKPEPEEEAALVVSLDPVPVSPVRALGTSYDFKVKVDSKMPAQGVSVQVDYRKDSDNSSLFSQTYTTTTTPLNVSVQGIPFNQVGAVTVVVTSKTKATNTVAKTFQ